MGASRYSYFGHFPQIKHFVDLIVRQNVLALHEITNKNVLL